MARKTRISLLVAILGSLLLVFLWVMFSDTILTRYQLGLMLDAETEEEAEIISADLYRAKSIWGELDTDLVFRAFLSPSYESVRRHLFIILLNLYGKIGLEGRLGKEQFQARFGEAVRFRLWATKSSFSVTPHSHRARKFTVSGTYNLMVVDPGGVTLWNYTDPQIGSYTPKTHPDIPNKTFHGEFTEGDGKITFSAVSLNGIAHRTIPKEGNYIISAQVFVPEYLDEPLIIGPEPFNFQKNP